MQLSNLWNNAKHMLTNFELISKGLGRQKYLCLLLIHPPHTHTHTPFPPSAVTWNSTILQDEKAPLPLKKTHLWKQIKHHFRIWYQWSIYTYVPKWKIGWEKISSSNAIHCETMRVNTVEIYAIYSKRNILLLSCISWTLWSSQKQVPIEH